jgi:hypothetical protein
MAAGFSEGFANGFGLVDAAFQRRRENEINQAKTENELAQQQLKNDRELQFHQDDVTAKQQTHELEQNKFRHQINNDNRDFGLKDAETASEDAYRQGVLGISRINAETSRMEAQSAIAENQAQTERYRLETQYAKQQKAREDAQRYVQANIFVTDPNTGEASIRWNKGNELNDLEMIQQATGINVGKIAGDFNRFNQDLKHIKSALAVPGYFQQNKAVVVKAFNDIEFDDINKGLGPYDGDNPEFKGGEVVRKEVTNVYPSPDGKGFVFNVRTVVNKGGKEFIDEGPMTQYRSSSPADNQIRVVGIDEIVRRVDGLDVLGIALATNPGWARSAANAYRQNVGGTGKKEITKVKAPVYDQNGMLAGDKELLYESQSGRFIDPERQLKAQNDQDEAAKWTANAPSLDERRKKAEYVLNNRSQFKARPDIIQAAQLIKGNQMALQPGLQDAERYSLSPALANVGVTAPPQPPRADNNAAVTRQQLINEINALTGGRFEIPTDATIDQLKQWLNENKAQQQPSPKPPMNNQSWAVRGAKAVGEGALELGAKKREQWSKTLDDL